MNEEIKKKIKKAAIAYTTELNITSASIDKVMTTKRNISFMSGAEFGYSLASEEQAGEKDALIDGYKQWGEDVKRLTKEIDVMLNGKDAAEQASLCDIVSQMRNDATKLQESNTVIAMQQQEIERLKAWKESAMSVMAPIQEIGKALGVPLGESIHDKILPGIEYWKQRCEAAERVIIYEQPKHSDLLDEWQKLKQQKP